MWTDFQGAHKKNVAGNGWILKAGPTAGLLYLRCCKQASGCVNTFSGNGSRE